MAGYSHRTATTAYPCYIPVLGRFSRSWSCKTCRYKGKGFLQDVYGQVEKTGLFHTKKVKL